MSSATLLDAIADIRAAAQQAATIGGDWYMPADFAGLLNPVDAALLIACEPVRLLEILDVAEQVLKPSTSDDPCGQSPAPFPPTLRICGAAAGLLPRQLSAGGALFLG